MKRLYHIVHCTDHEEWNTVVDWTEMVHPERFMLHYEHNFNDCICFDKESSCYRYAGVSFYQKHEEHGEIISFQQFKDIYMNETQATSQSPSESIKVTFDGGTGMGEVQLDCFKYNIKSFAHGIQQAGGCVSTLIDKNMELLEMLSRNRIKLELNKAKEW